MPEGVAISVLLCALAIAVVVETLIGAVFLRAAVALYNKMAGGASSPSGVPEPAFRKAMWITFANALAQIMLGALIGLGTDAGPTAPAARRQGVDGIAQLIFFFVSFLIMACILTEKLPTTFGRAVFVTLCYLLVSLLVGGVLGGLAVLVFTVFTVALQAA
jgi:hypothetical protein